MTYKITICTDDDKVDPMETYVDLFEYISVQLENTVRLSEPNGYTIGREFKDGKWTLTLAIKGLKQADGVNLTKELWIEFNNVVNDWLDRQPFAKTSEVRSPAYLVREEGRRRHWYVSKTYRGTDDEWRNVGD